MKYCNNCGEQLMDNYKICPRCGLLVDNNQQQSNNQNVQTGFQAIPQQQDFQPIPQHPGFQPIPQQNYQQMPQQQGFQPVNMANYNQFQYGYVNKTGNTASDIISTVLMGVVLFFQLGFIGIMSQGFDEALKDVSKESFDSVGPGLSAFAFVFVPLVLDIICLLITKSSMKKGNTALRMFNLIAGLISMVMMIIFAVCAYNYFS